MVLKRSCSDEDSASHNEVGEFHRWLGRHRWDESLTCPAVSQICSFMRFPSKVMVRILKSILRGTNYRRIVSYSTVGETACAHTPYGGDEAGRE